MSRGTTQREVFVDVSRRVPKLWADCWSWCCIVSSVGVFMIGVMHRDDGRCLQKGCRRTATRAFLPVGPGQARMRWCILKIQVRFLCLQHSDSGGEEGMSQLSCRHGPKWREWNINAESIRAQLKDSNPAKPTPHHGEWRAAFLLLRNTFYCRRWDAELGLSASQLQERM